MNPAELPLFQIQSRPFGDRKAHWTNLGEPYADEFDAFHACAKLRNEPFDKDGNTLEFRYMMCLRVGPSAAELTALLAPVRAEIARRLQDIENDRHNCSDYVYGWGDAAEFFEGVLDRLVSPPAPEPRAKDDGSTLYVRIPPREKCGVQLECGGHCVLASGHVVEHECAGDHPGEPGSCPA